MNVTLKLTHIQKKYGKKQVLKDIDLTLNGGSIVAFVGENGCGKSTLFKIILRLALPSSGSVCNENFFANGIIETPSFFPHLTGRENLIAFLRGSKIDEERLFCIAEEFHLQDDLDRAVRKYSLGMKQKLAIILVLLQDADIM